MELLLRRSTQIILAISVLANLVLSHAVHRDRAELTRLREAIVSLKEEARLKHGQALPTLKGQDLDGKPWQVDYSSDDRPTLIYVYSSDCGWCTRNFKNIRALAGEISATHRVVGLSLSPTPLKERRRQVAALGFPVLFDLAPHNLTSYRLGGTPETLIVGADGRLLEVWVGAYGEGVATEIERYFQVKLPGLLGPSETGSTTAR